jgi:hypothetical protein
MQLSRAVASEQDGLWSSIPLQFLNRFDPPLIQRDEFRLFLIVNDHITERHRAPGCASPGHRDLQHTRPPQFSRRLGLSSVQAWQHHQRIGKILYRLQRMKVEWHCGHSAAPTAPLNRTAAKLRRVAPDSHGPALWAESFRRRTGASAHGTPRTIVFRPSRPPKGCACMGDAGHFHHGCARELRHLLP